MSLSDKKAKAIKRKLANIIFEADDKVEELLAKLPRNKGMFIRYLSREYQALSDDYYRRGLDRKEA